MPEGYMPPSYNLFPSVRQVVGMLPQTSGFIHRSIYEEYEDDFADGTRTAGIALNLRYVPSKSQLETYSSFNMIVVEGSGIGRNERVLVSSPGNEGPLYYDSNYPFPDGISMIKLVGSFLPTGSEGCE